MTSFSEQLRLSKDAHLAINALERESRRRIVEAYQSWLLGELTDHTVRFKLEEAVKNAYRTSAEVARSHAGDMSGIPGWLPKKFKANTEYLDSLVQDVRRNLKTYKTSERSEKDFRRAVFRMQLSAGVAAQRGYTDSLIESYSLMAADGREVRKVWMTNTVDNVPCAECTRLHGTEVGLHENFPVPTKSSLKVYKNLQGPPRHPNCKCYLVILVVDLENVNETLDVDNPTQAPTSMTTDDVKKLPKKLFDAIIFTLQTIKKKVKRFFR